MPAGRPAGLMVVKPIPFFPLPEDHPVGPLDAIWHLLNFFAPALGVGLLTTAMAKVLWRRELRMAGFRRLALWASAGSAVGLLAALVIFGRDGKMAGYGLMLATGALGLWWAGFRARAG